MWRDQTIAVIFPTYRERASIRAAIESFERLGIVDDLIVVNNNAEPGTSEEVAATSAREIHEPHQGYGAAIRRGIAETDADLVFVVEPDGTFAAADVWKLLSYATEFDFVFGSRTLRDLVWDGANMGRFLRWGNWAVAKLIEAAFNTSSLSDVGCTMRVARGPAVRALLEHFTVHDGAFGPEMMLLSIIGRWRVIQVPVNYRAREGRPGTTESLSGAITIGLQMIVLVVSYRTRRARVARRLAASGAARSPGDAPPGPGGEPVHMFPRLRVPVGRWRR